MERISRALELAKSQARDNQRPQDSDRTRVVEKVDGAGSLAVKTEFFQLDADRLTARRIIAWNKGDPRTLAFDLLRTRILRKMQDQGWRTLAVIPATLGCGATTVAINLAWSIAQQTFPEVTLVDFDLRNPSIAEFLGIRPQADLSDYLQGRGALCSCIAETGNLRLSVLPTLRSHENSSELLSTSEAESLISGVKTKMVPSVAIFDLPPLLKTDDALVIIPQVDCVLLVLGENLTTKDEARAALGLLSGTHLVATVLNSSHIQVPSHVR
jgi:protein-tyrosine kinase